MGCGNSKVLPEPPEKDNKDNLYIKSIHSFIKKPSPKYAFEDSNLGKGKQHLYAPKPINKIKGKFDPRVVAKYEVKALIGRGSSNKVVQVERKGSKQAFAIKVVDVKEKKRKEKCDSELQVLRRVRHDYIVHLVEVFETPGMRYMVMELATGGELFDRIITRKRFSERDAVKILRMILEAVRYLHALGITHRDLKPQNLLYHNTGDDSKILLTDFGFASTRKSGDDTTMTDIVGTPEYIAPEVITKKPYTCAIDNWAVGVITYITLSGLLPFDDASRPDLYKKIKYLEYSFSGNPWPQVSDSAKNFIARFLTLDPKQRMTSSMALKHPWIANYYNQSSTDLHRSISENLQKRAYSRFSNNSDGSSSTRSWRSQHRTHKAKEMVDLVNKYNL